MELLLLSFGRPVTAAISSRLNPAALIPNNFRVLSGIVSMTSAESLAAS